MSEKRFKGAAFGSQTARFDVSAVHPANKRVGTYTEIPYCKRMTSVLERSLGPGTYNADKGDFSARAVAQRAQGPGWHRALQTAKEAQSPHLLYREAWTNKHFLKTKVGPGTYESTDFMQQLQKKPGSVRGVCDSLGKRFGEMKSCTPGPGSYGKGGVPWAALEEKRAQSAGCIRMDHRTTARHSPHSAADSGLSPSTYTLKSSVDMLLSRRVSNRGPYDLFTGRRDKPVMSGYFATLKHVGPFPGQYKVDSFGDELNRREKKKQGVFGRLDQYPSKPTERIYHSTLAQCPRPLTSPGPGTYEVTVSGHRVSHNPPPFLSSAPRKTNGQERQQTGNYNTVGPGRYTIGVKDQKKHIKGPTSSFKSQTQRYPSHPHRDKHMLERLRAVNVPMDRQSLPLGNGQSGGNLLVKSA